ncbi:MAG: hypothetical protein ACE5OY_06705 [Candidatus Bathyarchaeia archaeon]
MRDKWFWATIGTLCWAIAASLLGGYYYMQSQSLTAAVGEYERFTMRVNLCIDYGNGSRTWYNETLVPMGCNLLTATKEVADVESTFWPEYMASFVDSINGVANNATHYWMWSYWDEGSGTWAHGQVGADLYPLSPGHRALWRYERA